jgi:hypothetical protein
MPRFSRSASSLVTRSPQGVGNVASSRLNLVNTSPSLRSSTRNHPKLNKAGNAQRVMNMLATAFRVGLVSKAFDGGDVFDAVGVTPIVCANDTTTPARIDTSAAVPDQARYDHMVQDICNKYG